MFDLLKNWSLSLIYIARQFIVLKIRNELPLVYSAIPMGIINGGFGINAGSKV
jgi:hypothetical protein